MFLVLSVTRVRLNVGGYTYGKHGRYFGHGRRLYVVDVVSGPDLPGMPHYFRALDRAGAVAYALDTFKSYAPLAVQGRQK